VSSARERRKLKASGRHATRSIALQERPDRCAAVGTRRSRSRATPEHRRCAASSIAEVHRARSARISYPAIGDARAAGLWDAHLGVRDGVWRGLRPRRRSTSTTSFRCWRALGRTTRSDDLRFVCQTRAPGWRAGGSSSATHTLLSGFDSNQVQDVVESATGCLPGSPT